MTEGRHSLIEPLYQSAAELPPADRPAFLAAESDDAEVRGHGEKLLAHDQAEGGGLTDQFVDRFSPRQDLTQSAPSRGDVPLGVSPVGSSSSSIDHGRFLPGTVLSERYRIVGMLGKGGMGEVYRADDLELGQSVALKFLPKQLSADPRALERFRGEVRLARQVSHPNVCRVYDIGQIDGQWFLSMEYVDGEDLAQLLTRIGRFNSDRATELARQLCLGLHAAHEKGVLHRDLKPANIMIDGRGKLLITDFGLAEIADEIREDDIRSGTPAYMSPEQLAGREVSERSDIYSLGIILHEIYTGKPVWQAHSMAELFEKRKSGSSPTPSSYASDLDPVVESVINRCLDPDPGKRPGSTLSVVAALPGGDPLAAALAAGETPSPEMVANSRESPSLSKPLAVLALVGIAVGLILNVWLRDQRFGNSAMSLPFEPAVLRDEIREIVTNEFGYEEQAGESIYGFQVLSMFSEPGLLFWYRQRPPGSSFEILAYWSRWGQFSRGRPGFFRPREHIRGEMSAVLSCDKRLVYFRALPRVTADASPTPKTPAWSQWFRPEKIGFYLPGESAEFNETSGEIGGIQVLEPVENHWWRPPDTFDAFGVWRGSDPDGSTFLLTTGAFRDRPTYFRVIPEADQYSVDDPYIPERNPFVSAVFLSVILGAIGLAWQNHRSGRGDRFGARRLAICVFILHTVILLAYCRISLDIESNLGIFMLGMSQVLYSTVMIWVYYMAVEPFVRRVWPHILITSSRALDGRLLDPLIGRDLMIGIFSSVVTALGCNIHNHLVSAATNLTAERYPEGITLLGTRELIGRAVEGFAEPFSHKRLSL